MKMVKVDYMACNFGKKIVIKICSSECALINLQLQVGVSIFHTQAGIIQAGDEL